MYREQLEYFISSYQCRSFTDAAKHEHITPQGITKAMRSLEKELDVPLLLSRNDGSLVPTAFADQFYEYALEATKNYQRLQEAFKIIKTEEECLLRLGISFGLLDTVGISFLNQFEIINPDVKVVFSEDPDHICEEQLLNEQCDLAFTFAPFNEAFETRKLGCAPFQKWVNTDSLLSESEVIRVEDLRDHALATPGYGFKSYEMLMKLCYEKNVTPKCIQQSFDRSWIFKYVANNEGIGTNVGLLLDIENMVADGSVITLPFENLQLVFGISWRKNTQLNELQQHFVTQVQGYFR